MNEEEKIIQEQLQKLPENLRKAIEAVPWKSSVKEIAITNKLSFEQVATVERETMFILYGFENPDDYVGNLMREVQIDENTAVTIATEVNEKIFKAIALKIDESTKPQPPAAQPVAPETPPANLPMVEPAFAQGSVMVKKGEVAHNVAPATSEVGSKNQEVRMGETEKPKMPTPTVHYPGGQDPYREPLV